MPSNRRRLSKPNCRPTVRRLRFDFLEERRLLAGLDVFVFNDPNGLRTPNSEDAQPLLGKAVYVDLDNNGSLNSPEPWAVSDARGIASFPDLVPGNYVIRLLGNNNRVHQSFPTVADSESAWSHGFDKVLSTESDGTAWAIRFDQLVHLGEDLKSNLQTISFGNRTVLDAVLVSADEENRGFALTRLPDGLVQLWHFAVKPDVVPVVVPVDASDFASITPWADGLLVRTNSGGLIELQNPVQPSLTAWMPNESGVQQIKSLGSGTFVVEQSDPLGTRLSVVQTAGGSARILGSRTIEGAITSWDVSPSDGMVAVSIDNQMFVLDARSNLSTKTILTGATAPVIYDAARHVLITGDSVSENQLRIWDTNRWQSNISIAVSNTSGVSLRSGQFQLDEFGRFLIGNVEGYGVRQDLAAPSIILASVNAEETARVAIGIRVSGTNKSPEISGLKTLGLKEDESVSLNFSSGLSPAGPTTPVVVGQDFDGDSLVFVIRSNPLLGSLIWNQNGIGQYVPNMNVNGVDQIVVQAYDGLEWSPSQTIQLNIAPINDVPTEIIASLPVLRENSPVGTVLGTIRVDDPDLDADYEYATNDSRLSIVGGVIRLVSGNVSFEKESVLNIPITAFDRKNPSDVITKTLTVQVSDENDPPTAIVMPSGGFVPELNAGAVVGPVQVVDEDSNADYRYAVSDNRFEVVHGMLKLRDGIQLDYESEPEIRLTVTARENGGEGSLSTTLTISVTDQEDQPFELYFNCIEEVPAGSPGAVVGYAEVIDFSNIEYFFAVDDARFQVRDGVVSLKPGTSLTYAEPGYLDLTVTAVSELGETASKTARLYIVPDPTPHHNDVDPYDVDGDGHVTPLDPLIIINYINSNGIGPIQPPAEGEGQVPDIDVDGDGQITPIDILILINHLNASTHNQGDSGPSKNPIDTPDGSTTSNNPVDQSLMELGFSDSDLLARRRKR